MVRSRWRTVTAMRRWMVTVISSVAVLLITGGCSGSSGESANTTSTTSASLDVTTTLPPDEQAVVEECDAKIREGAADLAASVFPENPTVQWSLIDVVSEGGLSFVEVEPAPAAELRPRYRLVVECHAASEVVLYGVYELDGETWTVLTTTEALGDVELPETLG